MTFPIDVTATQDASVYDSPSNAANFGGRAQMWVQAGDQRRAFVYFARPFPLSATIPSLKLQLTQERVASSASRTITVQLVSAQWSESKITWDNMPAVAGPTASVTVTGAGTVGRVVEIDVTELMQQVSEGTAWFGFRIINSSSSGIYFRSSEATTGKPRLVGSYSLAPGAPTRLSPSAGRAVSLVRPTLTFDAPNGMTAYRYRLFAGDGAALVAPAAMSERFASFNINGIAGVAFGPRVAGMADTIIASGAAIVGAQEANSTSSPDEPGQVVAALNAHAGSSGQWDSYIGANLNVGFIDKAVFLPQWTNVRNVDLGNGDGKYLVGMMLKHIDTGQLVLHGNTHYLTSGFLTSQVKHTKVIITTLAAWAAEFPGVPIVLTGDFNAKSREANRPIGMLTLAGHLETRDLVDDVTNGTYNSTDDYSTNPMQGYWIDHVFVSGGATPTAAGLVDSGSSSDHNLVWANIEYATATALVGDLGAPTYDSGEIVSTVSQFQLPVDIADGGLVWWDVSARNDVDWSAWSEPVFFTRRVKPSLTITNPAAAPDNFVSEATPPFGWSSADQTAYRALITDPLDPTLVHWDSRRQGGADQSVTPPSALPLVNGQDYLLEVRTEDDVVREATPGDPIYQSATRLFTFNLSNTVAPVTALTFEQADERPWATIGFRMTTASDAVEILRDGVSLGTFTSADLHTTGTLYAFVDREVRPTVEHAWTVRRIVNGVTSATNPTVPGAITAEGVWVCSEDGTAAIVVADAEVQWTADEDVELFRAIGATRAHVVTRGIFGRTAPLSGRVVPWAGQTFEQARDALDALRPPLTPYGTSLIVTQSDECVRAFWTGVVDGARNEFGYADFPLEATLNEIP